jgi:hypothetical protein
VVGLRRRVVRRSSSHGGSSSEAPATKFDKKINAIFNDTKTLICRSTTISVRKYLSMSTFSPRPRLVRKGSAAAVAEAAVAEAAAAVEHAATELADLEKEAPETVQHGRKPATPYARA